MRRPDWKARLDDAISTASHLNFHYGQHDCVLFVAYCVDRMCDTDYVQRIKSTFSYTDELAAINIIQGYGGFKAMVNDWLGHSVPALQAKPGDVVLLINERRFVLGIMEGAVAVAPTEHGVIGLPMSQAACAWRIE